MAASNRSLSTEWIQETRGRQRATLLRCRLPHQVPFDVGKPVEPLPQLLRPTFAKSPAAGRRQRRQLFSLGVLRDGDQRDAVGRPADAGSGGSDLSEDAFKIPLDLWSIGHRIFLVAPQSVIRWCHPAGSARSRIRMTDSVPVRIDFPNFGE